MTSGAEVEVSQPKNVGWVVRFAETNEAGVEGTGGKEYADGNKVVRFWVAINELPSAQAVAFPDLYRASAIFPRPHRAQLSPHQ